MLLEKQLLRCVLYQDRSKRTLLANCSVGCCALCQLGRSWETQEHSPRQGWGFHLPQGVQEGVMGEGLPGVEVMVTGLGALLTARLQQH